MGRMADEYWNSEWIVAHEFDDGAFMSDGWNIAHMQECDWCSLCESQMEFYSGCELCGVGGHMSLLNYHEDEGYHLCDRCEEDACVVIEQMGETK